MKIRILKIARFSLKNRKKAKKRRFIQKFKKLFKTFEKERIVLNIASYFTKEFWTQDTRILKDLYANLTKELEENFIKKEFFRSKKFYKHNFTFKKYKKPMFYLQKKYTKKQLKKYKKPMFYIS